jgi:hypothetical protein
LHSKTINKRLNACCCDALGGAKRNKQADAFEGKPHPLSFELAKYFFEDAPSTLQSLDYLSSWAEGEF